jgi:hypothetical protein
MEEGKQVKNGKAFEYAIAKMYCEYICQHGRNAVLVENEACAQAKEYYEGFDEVEQRKFDKAANETIETMIKIEPGLMAQKDDADVLNVCLQKDQEGENGDVRDVVFSRLHPQWEIGFSAKNNNDAVKHSRLGRILDFGKVWLDIPCSQTYWDDIAPVFEYIEECVSKRLKWDDLGVAKREKVYVPLLKAFRREVLSIAEKNNSVPTRLVQYLIGNHPFYKIIKDDVHHLVVVKAFNIKKGLNKTVNGVKARYTTPRINFPTRIVEFEMKEGSDTTLNMILDGGWEISFRLHSANKYVERSLKFDIKLLGNPPVLFTQHLFQ